MLPHLKPLRKNSQSIKNTTQSSQIAESVKILIGAMSEFMKQMRSITCQSSNTVNVKSIQNLVNEQIQHSKEQNKMLEKIIIRDKMMSQNIYDNNSYQNKLNQEITDEKDSLIKQQLNKSSKDKDLYICKKYSANNKRKQLRFQYIDYPTPQNIFNAQQRQKQIIDWIGGMLKQVLSVGFNMFKSGELQQNKVKPFCSQNILRNLINLSKVVKLTKQQMQAINKSFVQQFIPYFVVKYPQTQQLDVNSRFSKMLIQRDLIDDNQYDFVYKSGIKFAYDDNRNYNSQIMQFLNYILQLPNQFVFAKISNQQLFNTSIKMIKNDQSDKFVQKQDNNLKHNKNIKQKQKSVQNKVSIRKSFFQQMQYLFKMIQSEQNLILMQKFDPHFPQSKIHHENQNKTKKSQSEKLEYRDKVKSYTSFQIGQKLSQGTKLFNEYQINSGNLKLRSSALMRVATKWCEQLQKCFDGKSILNHESPFRMKNGQQKYLQKNKVGYFNYLLLNQKKQIDNIMLEITDNNNYHQSQQMNAQLKQQLKKFSVDEAIIGQFCTAIFKNNLNYLINYLNLLIHGINKACIEFQKLQWCLVIKKQFQIYGSEFKRLKSIEDDNSNSRWTKIQSQTNRIIKNDSSNISIPSEVPELITFRIGDLLRCKCSSKQNQIFALYKQVQKRSKLNPDEFKILRVKNRLSRGNKDILMNILYKNTMIVQMQLAIKQQKSKFVQYSNKFNHYLYELKRAKFGPIMEMCSIWMSQDLRAKFYMDKLDNIIKRKKFTQQQKQKISQSLTNCCQKHSKITTLPFICDKCKYFYAEYGLDEKHMKCSKCQSYTCFLCQFQTGDIKQKLKNLPQFKQNQYFSSNQLQFIEHVPQVGGLIINLNSRDKKAITFYTATHQNNQYLFEYNQSTQKIKLIEEFDSKKISQSFLKQNVICSSKVIKRKLKINQDLIQNLIKKYFVGNYIKQNNKSQKISFSMVNQKLQLDMLQAAHVKYLPSVCKLNLSQNTNICKIEPLVNKFPNVQLAVLNQINIVQLPDDIWTKVTQLFLRNNKLKSIKKLSKCVNLIELVISVNQIQQIPDQIENNNKIQKLFIDNNKLKNISEKIGALTELKTLNIATNKQIEVLPNVFAQFKQLKVLQFYELATLNKVPDSFANLMLIQKLVLKKLDKIQRFPQQFSKLSKLKVLQVIENKNLKQFGFNLAGLSSLQILTIYNNDALVNLPTDMNTLSKLKQLRIQSNRLISQLILGNSNLRELQVLQIIKNNLLKTITEPLVNFDKLQILRINSSSIESLPQTLGNLSNLVQFQLKLNEKIIRLPQSLGKLKNLKKLNIFYNTNLIDLPKSLRELNQLVQIEVQKSDILIPMHVQLKTMQSLKILKIKNTKLKQFQPQLFNSLNFLQRLTIQKNSQLELLPQTMQNLKSLNQLIITQNQKLKMLPESLSEITTLQKVRIDRNPCLLLPKSFSQLKKIKRLRFNNNKSLKLHDEFHKYQQLKILQLDNNHQYDRLPDSICQLKSLQQMSIDNNQMLKQLPQNFGHLEQLSSLKFHFNNLVKTLPQSFGNLKSLVKLTLSSCSILQRLPQSFGNLKSLNQLKIYSLKQLRQLPQNFGLLSSLQNLIISANTQLQSLPTSIGSLKQLKTFIFEHNHSVLQIPQSLSNLTKLKVLRLNQNDSLVIIPANLVNIVSLERLETDLEQEAVPTTIRHLMVKSYQ